MKKDSKENKVAKSTHKNKKEILKAIQEKQLNKTVRK